MNHELACLLKNAGFPFVKVEAGMCCNKKDVVDFNPEGKTFIDGVIASEHFFLPTTGELIEECRKNGATFVSLKLVDGIWYANGFHNDKDISCEAKGDSPKEALGNLYLKLNAK